MLKFYFLIKLNNFYLNYEVSLLFFNLITLSINLTHQNIFIHLIRKIKTSKQNLKVIKLSLHKYYIHFHFNFLHLK